MTGQSPPRLFRVSLHVAEIDTAVSSYELVLGLRGDRVGRGRCYFPCEGALLVCVDPALEGHGADPRPNTGHAYIAVEDLDACFDRARRAGCELIDEPGTRPWGERSFYARDPSGNPLCFVDARTRYTGSRQS
jgi:catechol 2,3-dioxygenase-like lactoylglutathione lyase family enzyme